jgi:two-component system CheB/CheR fusion protein
MMANNLSWMNQSRKSVPETVLKTIEVINFAELCKQALLQFYAPVSVVTDLSGNVLYVYGETGKYLRPAPGQASLNIIDMAREGLPQELRSLIYNTASLGLTNSSRVLAVKTNGDFHSISVDVRLLPKQVESDDNFLLVSFHDVMETAFINPETQLPSESQALKKLQRELDYTRENLQRSIEERNAANEEYKCTHEEMQSTNEELQSTNEELLTSKEELQSVNEELITVNSELQSKIVQLSTIQNDMKNLFDNINVGIIFLDRQLKVRRFTRQVTQIYRLVDSDAGRLLNDIKSNLLYEDLLTDAQAVLDTLVSSEREVCTSNGACFQARIQPYRTLDNVIDGVVLTFSPIIDSTLDA